MFEFNATFIIAMISFVVFIMIMNTILYRPILKVMREREKYISSNYEDAKTLDKKSREFETERNSKITSIQGKCRDEFRTAVTKANEDASKEIKVAKENNKKEIQHQKEELLNSEKELINELDNKTVKDLASTIVEKVLKI